MPKHPKFTLVVQAACGNFLEMYDFMVFGYYAAAIGHTFFPTASAFAALMLALMTFGAGFLMRPLGAIVLGAYIDRHGRRRGLLVTLAMMAAGTLILACIPGYNQIGILAPLGVLFGRLLQGFSAGAELGGVSVYLAEIATPGHKGFYVAWQSASQQLAVVFAAALGVALNHLLGEAAMHDWGWRLPLLIGCAIVPFLLRLRRSLREDTASSIPNSHEQQKLSQVLRSLVAHWRLMLLGMMLVTMSTVSFYFITAYTPTFGGSALHLPPRDNLLVTVAVGLANFCWLPVMGALSDRIGRRPILLVSTVLAICTAYPALAWLSSAPSFSRLLSVELWLSLLYASYNGAMIVFLTEVVPPKLRTTCFSLCYSLAVALFGGFTPAASTYLIHATGSNAMPGVWLSIAAGMGLIACWRLRPNSEPDADARALC